MSQPNRKNTGNRDHGFWAVAVVLLLFVPPVGLLMILIRLLTGNHSTAKRGRHPYYIQKENQGPLGARTGSGFQQTQSSADPSQGGKYSIQKLARRGKRYTLLGTLIFVFFGLCLLTALPAACANIIQSNWAALGEELVFLLQTTGFAAIGACLLRAGSRLKKRAQRWRTYPSVIGARKAVPLSFLASVMNRSVDAVRADLDGMLEEGLFPGAFLHHGTDTLYLSAAAYDAQPVKPAAEHQPASPQAQENAILAEIRAVNDAVSNAKLSAQIDRIGVITAKILDYQKSHPEKSPQLHSFLSYYLPTTLKILRAYGQLESQDVSGQNITAAMTRIEGMMDKVVEGFEKQLDQLFQGDAMDITADVEVLERMLAKDGLASSGQNMTLNL